MHRCATALNFAALLPSFFAQDSLSLVICTRFLCVLHSSKKGESAAAYVYLSRFYPLFDFLGGEILRLVYSFEMKIN